MIALNLVLVVPVKAATLQASSTTSPYTNNVGALWTDIHNMETGTLGKSSVGAADGIDCHMVKRSEFGAAALLAISAYGARVYSVFWWLKKYFFYRKCLWGISISC